MTDRELLDRELIRLTDQGWRIVSQSDTSAQVMQPVKINEVAAGLLVILPILLGMLCVLFLPSFSTLLFGASALFALALVIEMLSKAPKMLFVTAASLRGK